MVKNNQKEKVKHFVIFLDETNTIFKMNFFYIKVKKHDFDCKSNI